MSRGCFHSTLQVSHNSSSAVPIHTTLHLLDSVAPTSTSPEFQASHFILIILYFVSTLSTKHLETRDRYFSRICMDPDYHIICEYIGVNGSLCHAHSCSASSTPRRQVKEHVGSQAWFSHLAGASISPSHRAMAHGSVPISRFWGPSSLRTGEPIATAWQAKMPCPFSPQGTHATSAVQAIAS